MTLKSGTYCDTSQQGTNLQYGSVLLENVQVKQWSDSVIYTDDKTDSLGIKKSITVTTHVHDLADLHYGAYDTESNADGDGRHLGATGTAAAAISQRLTSYLLHPRRKLLVTNGEHKLLRVVAGPASDPDTDIDNGPKPTALSVDYIMGKRAFQVTFSIEVTQLLCNDAPAITAPSGSASITGVLSNRWSISETRDAALFMTRTVTGQLKVAHIDLFADNYRYLTIPPLARGFQRQEMDFGVSKDGLTLSYTFRDRQRQLAPPAPAIDWDVTHNEAVTQYGAKSQGSISITLKSPPIPNFDKRKLIPVAFQTIKAILGDIGSEKFIASPGDNSKKGNQILIHSVNGVDRKTTSDITFNVAYQRFLTAQNGQTESSKTRFNLVWERFGKPLEFDPEIREYDAELWPSPQAYDGNNPIRMLAAYWQNPCGLFHGHPDTTTGYNENGKDDSHGNDKKENKSTVRVFSDEQDGSLPEVETDKGISSAQREWAYTHIEIESTYLTSFGVATLPIAFFDAGTDTGQFSATFEGGATTTSGGTAFTEPTAAIFQTNQGITFRKVNWHIERVNNHPVMPRLLSADPNGIKETLVEMQVLTHETQLNADAKDILYRTEGEYVYALHRTPTQDEYLRVPSAPWDRTKAAEVKLKPADYLDTTDPII